MAWNLAAVGGDIAAEAEHALLAELNAVLSKAEYATSGSSLHGEAAHADPVHGVIAHEPPPAPIPDAAPAPADGPIPDAAPSGE